MVTNDIGLWIFLALFVVAFAVLIVVAVTRGRRAAHPDEILFGLGFTRAEPPPPQLVEVVSDLSWQDSGRVQLDTVYQRPIAGGQVFLLNRADAGRSAGRGTALAAVSQALDLPRFVLLPKGSFLPTQASSGFVARLVDAALDAAASRTGMVDVGFGDDPEFAENFLVLAEDAAAVKRFLAPSLCTQLLEWDRRYVIDAGGPVFALSKLQVHQADGWSEEELAKACEDAEVLLYRFRRAATDQR